MSIQANDGVRGPGGFPCPESGTNVEPKVPASVPTNAVCPTLPAGTTYTDVDHYERYLGAMLVGHAILIERMERRVWGAPPLQPDEPLDEAILHAVERILVPVVGFPPEAEWFRPPKMYECAPDGDARRFLLVAEPRHGEGVYGVSWKIGRTYLVASDMEDEGRLLLEIASQAKQELYARMRRGQKTGEGQGLDAFAWDPSWTTKPLRR